MMEVRPNVRFILATNLELRQEVRQGTFREDLFPRKKSATTLLPEQPESA